MDPLARDEQALARCRGRAAHARGDPSVKAPADVRRAADDFFGDDFFPGAVAELKSRITVACGPPRRSADARVCRRFDVA
jgi:hypothetical protein